MTAILKDPENRKGVTLTRTLDVYLPTGEARQGYAATIKAFSPPIDPDLLPKDGSKPNPPMLDAAIIKIEAKGLPTVRLASSASHAVALGQQLVIVGYPGVVVWHDFLSKKSRAEATITFGRVSAFRMDVNERWILQTDAPISWGNSGGPAFNIRGEVVALATFISTSLEGDQAIQGFNFLIPIDSIHAQAKQLGVTPSTDSPFTREWDRAVEAFIEGRSKEAIAHAEAADKLVPGLIDVQRAIVRFRQARRGSEGRNRRAKQRAVGGRRSRGGGLHDGGYVETNGPGASRGGAIPGVAGSAGGLRRVGESRGRRDHLGSCDGDDLAQRPQGASDRRAQGARGDRPDLVQGRGPERAPGQGRPRPHDGTHDVQGDTQDRPQAVLDHRAAERRPG